MCWWMNKEYAKYQTLEYRKETPRIKEDMMKTLAHFRAQSFGMWLSIVLPGIAVCHGILCWRYSIISLFLGWLLKWLPPKHTEPKSISGVLDAWCWRCLQVSNLGRAMLLSKHYSRYAFKYVVFKFRSQVVVRTRRILTDIRYTLLLSQFRSETAAHTLRFQKTFLRKARGFWRGVSPLMQIFVQLLQNYFKIRSQCHQPTSTSTSTSKERLQTRHSISITILPFSLLPPPPFICCLFNFPCSLQ